LFGLYRDEALFAELFVTFFVQIVDMQNEKLFRVRIEDPQLLLKLGKRIGFISIFPYIQPEQCHFVYDFAEWDQRMAANILLNLARIEDPDGHKKALSNPHFILADGTEDHNFHERGIPLSWFTVGKMPAEGVFSVTYICAPESRKFANRKRLYESYNHRPLNQEEKNVLWWSSLRDAPSDLLDFLDFLSTRYDNMQAAWVEMCGDEHGVITLQQFKHALTVQMECKKFQGYDEMERIRTVFRSLDSSNEGEVSVDEFMVLEQMFNEILLSISEFVEFCLRTFGENLEEAWTYLDEDGSGEIERDEWVSACAHLGYCGPVHPIFKYLDKDDEGTVSGDEFQLLEKFKPSNTVQ
jgi:Ca2+-binding EF-hand superfamily protein